MDIALIVTGSELTLLVTGLSKSVHSDIRVEKIEGETAITFFMPDADKATKLRNCLLELGVLAADQAAFRSL